MAGTQVYEPPVTASQDVHQQEAGMGSEVDTWDMVIPNSFLSVRQAPDSSLSKQLSKKSHLFQGCFLVPL